jgi:integrase
MFLSKRRGYWYVFLEDEHGKRRTVSTRCRLKGDAMRFLASFKESDLSPKPELKEVTLQEFSAPYLQWARSANTKKTVQGKESALRDFTRIVGNLPLHRIGVQDIDNFLSQKTVEASTWTARKYFTALAAIFETAVRWGHLDSNPFRQINKPRVPELIPQFFSRSEFQQLLRAIDSPLLWGLVICAVSTGMRLGELLSLQWVDTDFATRVVIMRNRDGFTTKSKRNRVIPLTEALRAVLLERSAGAPAG